MDKHSEIFKDGAKIYLRENGDGTITPDTVSPVFQDGAFIPDLGTDGRAVIRQMIENLVHGVARTLELQTYLCNQLFGNEIEVPTIDPASISRDQFPVVVIGGAATPRLNMCKPQENMISNSYCFVQNIDDNEYRVIVNINGKHPKENRINSKKTKQKQSRNDNVNNKSVGKKNRESVSFKDDQSVCYKADQSGLSLSNNGDKSVNSKIDKSCYKKDGNPNRTKSEKRATKMSRVRKWFAGLFTCIGISKHKK